MGAIAGRVLDVVHYKEVEMSTYPQGSLIDDPSIRTLEDLRRHYPLPGEYAYAETADGDFVVQRLSDGTQFAFLLEEELLSFDVPVQDPKRRKMTVEVDKQG
jgi:hypothetical protein